MSRMRHFPSLKINGEVRTLVIVFGDQLDHQSAAFASFDDAQDGILMVEAGGESTHVPSHVQRTVMFLAAMRHFAIESRDKGRRVAYVCLDDDDAGAGFDDRARTAIGRIKPGRIVCVRPGEWRMVHMVKAWERDLGIEVEMLDDDHFLCSRAEFEQWAADRKTMVMEHFYRWQRKRLSVLVDDDGKPVGGRWNFDDENRESFSSAPEIRKPYRARPDAITQEVIDAVKSNLPDLPGRIDHFRWPVTRTEAKRALKDFIEHRLGDFGTYEDAMWTGETTVNHSRLSAALNLKLLRPMECVEAAIEAYERDEAPINSVEGFVRQIIGWREFIRGVYWREGDSYRDRNALEHDGELPEFYWTGETDMACMKHALSQILDEAYGHHIQRLMVTGNFALMAGIHPRQVSDWYLGMYADAVDWVTLPNTLGMALHADGGVVGTKPYAASGKYINRMSNYCEGCRYDVNRRSGEDACPFNTLYWDFLIGHRARFKNNHRMAMMLKNVDRISKADRVEITVSATSLRERLGVR